MSNFASLVSKYIFRIWTLRGYILAFLTSQSFQSNFDSWVSRDSFFLGVSFRLWTLRGLIMASMTSQRLKFSSVKRRCKCLQMTWQLLCGYYTQEKQLMILISQTPDPLGSFKVSYPSMRIVHGWSRALISTKRSILNAVFTRFDGHFWYFSYWDTLSHYLRTSENCKSQF